jgi:hypothetical protein
MADEVELDIFGQPVQYDIGQNVLYDEGADDRTITNANDFAATYKNKEQFEGVEAAAEWARTQGLEYGIDASRVDAFLQNETYDPGAYLNNEVDFVVGGYDTDLDTPGFQASNPGELIVTGDANKNATITYPDNVDIFGESAGTTVDAGTVYGTPPLVVGEPVSGIGGFTMLNPGGVSFTSGGALNNAYNILARNGANILGANEAARDIGSGMSGEMWIAMYEDILPVDYVKLVADAFGIEWEPDEDEDDDSSSNDDDTPTVIIPPGGGTGIIPGSGSGSTGIGGITTVADGPGGSYPNLGYYTDEGYGPYFTPDSSYSSITPFVSPNTGNTLANLYDVGVNPNQFLGGPPTSTTNQPLSSFGYSEDTFAPSVGGIFNLDNFKDLNVKGLTFANYKGSGDTSVITGGVNGDSGGITSLTGGGNNTSLIGGGQGVDGGITGGSTLNLNPDVITDYDSTIEDVDTIDFDDGSITGNPLGDLVLIVGAENLLTSGFEAFSDYWAGRSETEIATDVPWGADMTSSNQTLLSTGRTNFDAVYNQQGPYQSWLDAGNTGTIDEYNTQIRNTYLDQVEQDFGKDVRVGEEVTIEQRIANGEYDETQDTTTDTTETLDGDDGPTNIFDDFNWDGDSGSFLAGLQTIGFDSFTPPGTTNVEFLDANNTAVTGTEGSFSSLVSDIVTINEGNIDLYPGSELGDTLYLDAGGEALTGVAKLNAQATQALSTLTPDFIENAFTGLTESIPPGVQEGLKIFAQIGGGIDAYANLVQFIDDPEPESALKTAAGVLAASGNFAAAIVVKGIAEVVDALFNGYDQQPHRTVYSNIDFDVFEPLSYSQADYDSDKAASEGVNMFMDGVGQLISPDIQALEEEYGIDIKGDLQLAYSDLDGFFYTIGNEDVTGFLERLDARDGGVDIPESNLYRKNLGTFDFENPENLQDQLIEFKETILGDIRRALDAGYTDFSNFQQVMKDINLGDEWARQKEATGMSDSELMNYLISFVNPAQSGPNPAGELFSWGIRNNKTNYGSFVAEDVDWIPFVA